MKAIRVSFLEWTGGRNDEKTYGEIIEFMHRNSQTFGVVRTDSGKFSEVPIGQLTVHKGVKREDPK